MSFKEDVQYFYRFYKDSVQAKIQSFETSDLEVIFREAVYCFLTPATKAESAYATHKVLFMDGFFFRASQEEIAACLRAKPYIRFHNQKAQRLLFWREYGKKIITDMLAIAEESDKREFLVENVYGMSYKEASHFLRNIGMGRSLAILDRHIINFMKESAMLPVSADFSQVNRRYKDWEKVFIDFALAQSWTVPEADFAVWAAGVKRSNPYLTYEEILELK